MALAPSTRKTTTRTSTVRRTTASRTADVEPQDDPQIAEAEAETPETAGEPAAPGRGALRKKELIDRVVAASGKKKKDVKPVVEAMLDVLGASLAAGETMNLQPFGKLVINRRKDAGNGEVLVAKIRRSTQALDADQEALAEPGE